MSDTDEKPRPKPVIVRNATDLQRLKLERLMKNPEKEVIIPERAKERAPPKVTDFVRNVMGSSAGAGSGEFHVFRNLRRKEYARQKHMHAKGEQERLDQEFRQKVEESNRKTEEKTSKKRAKRNKRKEKIKLRKLNKNVVKDPVADDAESDSGQEEEDKTFEIIAKES